MPSFMPCVFIGLSFKTSSTMVMATSSNLFLLPPSTRTKIKQLTAVLRKGQERARRTPSEGPKKLTFIEKEKRNHFVWQSTSDTLI